MRLINADVFIEENKEIIDCEIDHPKYQDTLRELIDEAPTVNIDPKNRKWEYLREQIIYSLGSDKFMSKHGYDKETFQFILNLMKVVEGLFEIDEYGYEEEGETE